MLPAVLCSAAKDPEGSSGTCKVSMQSWTLIHLVLLLHGRKGSVGGGILMFPYFKSLLCNKMIGIESV